MKIRRADRLVDMTNYLLARPHRLISLTYFSKRYESAKSSISEDLVILRRTFKERGIGILETVPGAAGGARFVPSMSQAEANEFVEDMIDLIQDTTRVLPGGYVFLSDLLGQPEILNQIGRLMTTQYLGQSIDAVMTTATKGVPIAQAVAEKLNVPFVIVRTGTGKVTEGPTMSVNYLTGSSKRVERMELSRRSLQMGSKVLIVDDFMKAGGTVQGMRALVKEFEGEVVGVSVFSEGRSTEKIITDFTSLVHVDVKTDGIDSVIKVTPGNYQNRIYTKRG